MTNGTRKIKSPTSITENCHIPNEAEAVEAMAAGKIDCMNQNSYKGARVLQKTNPEIIQSGHPGGRRFPSSRATTNRRITT